MTAAGRRLAACALGALLALPGARAGAGEEHPDCAPLVAVLDQAASRFSTLAGSEYSTRFDARRATITLPGFGSCWVDDVSLAFWCMEQSQSPQAAGRSAAAQAKIVERCWPDAPTRQDIERGDDGVTRLVQDWVLRGRHRLRLVQRKPNSGPGLGSVFLYLY